MSDREPRLSFQYKSVRLLVEAIHKEMDNLRKAVMNCELPGEKSVGIYDAMGELRLLFDELGAKADRPTLEDVTKQSPGDYVATMKPLVGKYHRQLMIADKLAPCLCEDLQATGVILMLIGDGKTVVRTAADPNRPEVQLAVEAILQTLDGGIKQVMTEGVEEAEKQLGISAPVEGFDDAPQPLRVKYFDLIQEEDFERNTKAELVIDMNDIIVKDRMGDRRGQKATQEEIDSCIVVKDPGTDDVP